MISEVKFLQELRRFIRFRFDEHRQKFGLEHTNDENIILIEIDNKLMNRIANLQGTERPHAKAETISNLKVIAKMSKL